MDFASQTQNQYFDISPVKDKDKAYIFESVENQQNMYFSHRKAGLNKK